MKRFALHERVYVRRDYAERPVGKWGRVVRLRRADFGGWIDLDERVDDVCPFPPFKRWQDDAEQLALSLVDALVARGWDFALVQVGHTVGIDAGELRHAGAVSRRCTARGAPTLKGQAAQLRVMADELDRQAAELAAAVAAERGEAPRQTVVVVDDRRERDESGGVH